MKAAATTTAARPAFRMSAQGLLRMAVRSAFMLPLLAVPGVPVAAAAPFGSAQWFSQAAAAQQPAATGRPPAGPIGAVPGRIVSPQEAQATAQKSIYNLTRATQAIMAAREAQGVAHTQALLGAQGLVPDGLDDDGLLPSDQAQDDLADPALCQASNSCVWQNATLPMQSSDRGRTTVTINQFDKKAILTWDSFSVGANTVLRFDQSLGTQADGNNDWVALNRVTAGSSPSTILGQIRADGSVYLINHNGVVFGGSSQVDTHSLLVSSLPLYLSSGATALLPEDDPDYLAFSNDLFLNSGLTAVGGNAAAGNILGLNSGQNAPLAANLELPGDIALEQGALLNVSKLGFALFAAPNVNNAGSIRATDGQVILAAGLGVALRNAASGSLLLQPVVSGRINDVENANADATPVGKVTNSGLIEAVRGDVRLLGGAIEQGGVVAATSSISRPGTLVLSAIDEQAVDSTRARTGSLLMTAGSVTTVLPDGNGETTISSASATEDFRRGSISLTGAAVTLQGNGTDANNNAVAGALIAAPGQNVSISAVAQNDNNIAPRAIADDAVAGRLYLGEGASVDVAGIADNQLDMAIKFITVPRLGLNELADSPLQRDGILFASSVVIDSRVTGTRADGVQWVGTSVANLSGYVQQVTRDIKQMLLNGGNIDLAGGEVIQRQGSLLNLDAGFSHFINNGALPQTTRLVTDNGVTVDISQANPDEHYVGFAGKTTDAHSRWNITTVASDPLGRGTRNDETDFIEGGNAGRLSVYGATATVLDGDISASTVAGRYQIANATLPAGGTLYMGQGNGNALLNRVYPESPPVVATQSYLLVEAAQSLAGILALGEAPPPVEVPPEGVPPAEGTPPIEVVPVPVAFTEESFTASSALPDVDTLLGIGDRANWRHWTQVSAQKIRDAGFSAVNIVADDPRLLSMGGEIAVAAGTNLSVQPGGSITLSGSRISVDGMLRATAGSIALTATGRTDQIGTTIFPYIDTTLAPVVGDITLGSGALLDARGEWVNDTGRDENQLTGGAFINGGSVSLQTLQAATVSAAPRIADTTGAVVMNAGSRIDVSSGGRILPSGALAGGLLAPSGRGGSIVLETYVPALVNFGDIGAPPIPLVDVPPHSGNLLLGGTFSGFGFGGGGTLSLRMPGLQIGGEANAAQPWNLVLPEAFFSQLGFDNIVLKSEYNALITNNTQLRLQQSSFLPDFNLLADVATGTDLRSVPGAVTIGLRDDYYRRPQNLSIYAGDYVNWITNRFGTPNYSAAGIDGATTLGANASLVADPGAAVTLGSHTQVTVLGSIIAHGGSITLTGDTANGGYAQNPGLISTAYSADSKSVWLGADSLLDASGVVLLDPLATARRSDGTPTTTGRVLAGGTVTLTNDTGYVVGLNCTDLDPACDTGHKATINVSGTHALLDVAAPGRFDESFFKSLDVGSDAGTIRLGAGNGLFFNGKLQAQAGNTNAQGGTLLVTPANGRITTSDGSTGALQLEVFSHALQMPVAEIELEEVVGKHNVLMQEIIATTPLLLGDDISNALFPYLTADWLELNVTPGVLMFSTTVLGGSGLSTLRLGSDPLRNINRPVPVVFTDNTGISMGRELSINASILTATPPQYAQVVPPPRPEPGDDPDDPEVFLWDTAINVDLSAPYVRLTGLRFGGNYETLPDDLRFGDTSSLNVTAGAAMDIGGHIRMDNWKSINLFSRGDLRFITPSTFAYLGDPANSAQVIRSPGLLETTADLSLSAAQIYPATDERFIIQVHPTYSSDITITLDEDGEEEESDPTEPVFVRGAVNFARYPTGTELQTPLSVGGSLVVDARRISQGGILRAPGGQIALGLGTSAMELNEAWDAQSLALLTYTALDEAGDALLMQLPGVITLKTYINKGRERTEQIDSEERFDVPLIASEAVTFMPGSETSVSFGDQVVPYGATIDGANLRYNGSASSGARAAPSSPDLTSAPGKQIVSMADTINVQAGAVIDLSGGGTLQAQEWVAGTGGSRDLLAATITRYTGGNTGVQVPQYADGRALYAILPGYDLKLAPYDPELVQSPLLGKSVWLSGGDGLASGMYTLLPARYATLPGAYRVVQDTRLSDFDSSRNEQLPDGTLRMSGHIVDTFNNKRDALESAFLVQSDAVWRQYSEYRLTDLNTYFAAPAHSDNADWLPHDAGQLAVFADTALKLNGSFLTGAGAAGAGLGAELNIAAPAVQVLDDAGIALAGYLQLDAETLNSLGFSRLVFGGISVRTAGGAGEVAVDLLKPMARAVDISTTQTPLTAGEIVALTQSSSDEEGNAGDGIRVQGGSRIIATGTTSAARTRPIQVGVVDDSDEVDNSTAGYNGGGALLLVSSAAEIAAISRDNLNEEDLAALRIGQNAQLTGNSVLLDSTGVMNIDPSVQFDTDALTLASGEVTFSSIPSLSTPGGGLVIGQQLFDSFSNIGTLSVLSRGSIAFDGDANISTANALLLSASVLEIGAHQVTLTAPVLGLASETIPDDAPEPDVGTGSLHIIADELRLGAGVLTVSEVGQVDVRSNRQIIVTDTGVLNFGEANVALHTPLMQAETGADARILTTGALSVDQVGVVASTGATAIVPTALGGGIALEGGSLAVDTRLVAASGVIDLHSLGNITLGEQALLSTAGISRQAFDVVQNTPGGIVSIVTDEGDVAMAAGAVIDVSGGGTVDNSGAAQGGAITISALQGGAALQGGLRGRGDINNGGASHGGGAFALISDAAIDLNDLVDRLAAGGIQGAVDVTAAHGNLQLAAGHVLRARDISLAATGGSGSADALDGNVVIDGDIDASGSKGGRVELYGRSNVNVNGTIDAHGTATDRRGGDILLRTDAGSVGAAAALNTTWGYQGITAAMSGAINLGATAALNVSGGSAGGLSGGKVRIRAPLLDDGDVNVSLANGAVISGAREASLEAVAVWSTLDASVGSQHFDGIVDPAGLYDASGVPVFELPNPDHITFYTQTLRDFVQQPGFVFAERFNGVANFNARAGIALVNPGNNVNYGDISVLSDWNLGAGTLVYDEGYGNGLLALEYRTHGYWAPVLHLDAANDILLAASLSDGFFQRVNPLGNGSTDNSAAPVASNANPLPFATAGLAGYTRDANGNVAPVDSTSFDLRAGNDIRISGHQEAYADPGIAEPDPNADPDDPVDPQPGARLLVTPTMLRTGTGSISLRAGNDFVLEEEIAPGVIYTAGRVVAGTTPIDADEPLVETSEGLPAFLDVGIAHSEAAGDISLIVGNDVLAIQSVLDSAGDITGISDSNLTQFWWPWMQRACVATDDGCGDAASESAINFGMFHQGLMSIGGNISVAAAGKVNDLSVSLPVTWTLVEDADENIDVQIFGGGDLSVNAGRGISSGSWYLGRGQASVRTQGGIDFDILEPLGEESLVPVGTQIALQDARVDVVARGNLSIEGIHNPAYLFRNFDSLGYTARSAVSLASVAGLVVVGNEARRPGEAYGTSEDIEGVMVRAYDYLLPATVSLASWSDRVLLASRGELYPSPQGQWSIIAQDDIVLFSRARENNTWLGMIDADPTLLPSPLNLVGENVQVSFIDNGAASNFDLHRPAALHLHDDQPVRIYSVAGSVINSNPFTFVEGFQIFSPKRADIRAAEDIINLTFAGQNLYTSDITTLSAGRDIINTPLLPGYNVPYIELGGPGVLAVSAGRNLGPLTSTNDAWQFGYLPRLKPAYPGIRTVANERNAWLPRTGADIAIGFGNGAGVAFDDFTARYVDPSVSVAESGPREGLRSSTNTPDYRINLMRFVQQYLNDQAQRNGAPQPAILTAGEAWNVFAFLPEAQRRYFASRIFLNVLDRVGLDYNDAKSDFKGEYARGYQAINLMFPPLLGYTLNNAQGGTNGAEILQTTGIFDMRGSTVQTRHGGDISILGPGGQLLVGSASSPPTIPASGASAGVGPSTQGILALEKGGIGIFTDSSVLLAQSRIFTQQGGDVLIWSSNGDINAGKGAKTNTEVPPAAYLCDPDHFCLVDAKSQVSGAGIAVLQTRPGATAGSANLVAPRGTVDAGDAGIRVAGRLNVAAFRVANADNIQVAGAVIGVPTGAVDTGALAAANAAGSAASKVAESVTASRKGETAGSVLDVQVADYGDADCEGGKKKSDRTADCGN